MAQERLNDSPVFGLPRLLSRPSMSTGPAFVGRSGNEAILFHAMFCQQENETPVRLRR
jgi:hypothetical protein